MVKHVYANKDVKKKKKKRKIFLIGVKHPPRSLDFSIKWFQCVAVWSQDKDRILRWSFFLPQPPGKPGDQEVHYFWLKSSISNQDIYHRIHKPGQRPSRTGQSQSIQDPRKPHYHIRFKRQKKGRNYLHLTQAWKSKEISRPRQTWPQIPFSKVSQRSTLAQNFSLCLIYILGQ